MKGNSFGRCFSISTWGESHGPGLGVVIDGCPAGIPLTEEDFSADMRRRQGGNEPYTTQRREEDFVYIDSGVFEGVTTGAPIHLRVANTNIRSQDYENFRNVPRPGHADASMLMKHGVRDHRGGGRSSARETTARVLAGVVAKKILPQVTFLPFLRSVGTIPAVEYIFHEQSSPEALADAWNTIQSRCQSNSLPFPVSPEQCKATEEFLHEVKQNRDSVGGSVELWLQGVPAGLGEPVFQKLSAELAKAMMSLPAAVAFECGAGSRSVELPGSQIRDAIGGRDGYLHVEGCRHGGQLGGISTGSPLFLRVGFHAPTSIQQPAASVNTITGETVDVSVGGRHDVFPLPRALVMVEAMAALVLVDMMALAGRLPDRLN